MLPVSKEAVALSNICSYCQTPAAKSRCGGCKSAYYCDRNCQSKHWKEHKKICRKMKHKKKSTAKKSNAFALGFSKLYNDTNNDQTINVKPDRLFTFLTKHATELKLNSSAAIDNRYKKMRNKNIDYNFLVISSSSTINDTLAECGLKPSQRITIIETINNIKGASMKASKFSGVNLELFRVETKHCYTDWNCKSCLRSNRPRSMSCEFCISRSARPGTPYSNHDMVNLYKCNPLMRILHALKYYSSLRMDEESSNGDVFVSFIQTEYPYFLNDYQHVLSHSDKLEDIHEQIISDDNFGNCNWRNCQSFCRYYRDLRRRVGGVTVDSDDYEITDSHLLFYRQIFDNMHQWLYHLFDAGMRAKRKVSSEEMKHIQQYPDDESNDMDECIDPLVKKIRHNITSKSEALNIDVCNIRPNGRIHNKFTIPTIEDLECNDDQTFLDMLFQRMEDLNISNETIDKIKGYLKQEQCDTLCLQLDIDQYDVKQSNIYNLIKDEKIMKIMGDEFFFYHR